MPRPKKEKPTRADGRFEYKAAIGRTIDGKIQYKSFYSYDSKEDARAKAEQYKVDREVAARTGDIFSGDKITFDVWAQKWLRSYKKPTVTPQTYRNTYLNTVEKHLLPYFGSAQLIDIKQIDIQNFYATKSSTCSESLLHKMKLCLCGIFEAAIENDLIYKNPAKHAAYISQVEKHEKHVYTDGQIIKAKQYFKTDFFDVFLMLETGIRRGELLGLMWKDVDLKNKTLKIERSIAEKQGGGVVTMPPKWDSYRTIPISQELTEALQQLPHDSVYVLPNIDGNVQTPRSWSRKLERHMKTMVKNCHCMIELTAHELRHTRGTQLRRNGVDIYTIQKLLGHKDVNVTAQVYVHDDIETTRAAAGII